MSYTYDDSGIRTQKIVNDVATDYYLNGNQIVTQLTDGARLDFFYDENGSLFGFNYNGANYYYIRNGQNDIIGILDSTGTQVVSYQYDTWGKLLGISGSQASGVGTLNPFRYRGYYYDTETGLYYLNSRYYDPNTGRYLNADSGVGAGSDILAANVFAYCGNNPVSRFDPSGHAWWHIAIGVACIVAIVAIVVVSVVTLQPELDLADGPLAVLAEEDFATAAEEAAPEVQKIASEGTSDLANQGSTTALKFSQNTASPNFSDEGTFAGKTNGQLASELRSGVISPAKVPVEFVNRGSNSLIVNTRSSLALMRGGIPQSLWNLIDKTDDPLIQDKITNRLAQNGLTDSGTDVIRITGFGKYSSNLQ